MNNALALIGPDDMLGPPVALGPREQHPAAKVAVDWLNRQRQIDLLKLRDRLHALADAGDRGAALCLGTLEKLRRGQSAGDRYVTALGVYAMFEALGRKGL